MEFCWSSVILEFWALFGNFPKALAGFRKHYWGSIGRAITSLILLLYGVWVLYCIFQFTRGDSWAAKTLAGVTLGLFTGILLFFSFKIWSTARKLKQSEGDASGLYDDKSIWVKYSLFYESYRKDYWWIFVPTLIYTFAKYFAIAAANGRGMVQTIAVLAIEAVMMILLIWTRPYERRSGNVINIIIQVVRVLVSGLHPGLCRRIRHSSDYPDHCGRCAHRRSVCLDWHHSHTDPLECDCHVLQAEPPPQEAQGSW